jgi:hypothetical protein
MIPSQTLDRFDAFLGDAGQSFRGVVIGGAALALLGVTSRQTRDCDVLDPPLTDEITRQAREFAALMRIEGLDLADDWLNNGPASLAGILPPEWRERLVPLYQGRAIVLHTLGRSDLLRSKLFALCDRGTDLPDCLALEPTQAELEEIQPWVALQDAHPGWPEHVSATLSDLAGRLGYGV